MNWSDSAIVLRAIRHGESGLAVSLLTHQHGRCQGRLTGVDEGAALPGASLEVGYTLGGIGEPGAIDARETVPGVDPQTRQCITVLRTAASLVHAAFELGEPVPRVFDALSELVTALRANDDRWPAAYVRVELESLRALGWAGSLIRNEWAFRRGAALYLVPASGRIVTHAEAGAFIDRLVPVPGLLMGKTDARRADALGGLTVTGLLFDIASRREGASSPLPDSRGDVVSLVRSSTMAPRHDRQHKEPTLSKRSRNRLLLGFRELLVPNPRMTRS